MSEKGVKVCFSFNPKPPVSTSLDVSEELNSGHVTTCRWYGFELGAGGGVQLVRRAAATLGGDGQVTHF